MPRYTIKNLKANSTVQFQAGADWNTIQRLPNGELIVFREGKGDYEYYDIDEEGADRLIATATSRLF